jgi:ankyrin repeat protein
LLQHGTKIDRQTKWGSTALMFTAYKANVKVVRVLVEHGSNICLRDHHGHSALDWAKSDNASQAVFDFLIKLARMMFRLWHHQKSKIKE